MYSPLSCGRLTAVGLLVLAFSKSPCADTAQNPASQANTPKRTIDTSTPNQPASGLSQGQDTTGQSITNPDGSTVADNRYTNPFLGFAVDFPKGWLLFSNADAKKNMPRAEDKIIDQHAELKPPAGKPDPSTPLLVVAEPTGYKNSAVRRSFKIVAGEIKHDNPYLRTPVDYLNYLDEMGKKGTFPVEFLSLPELASINGIKLGKAYAKMPWEDKLWYAVIYAVRQKNYMIHFIFVSPDREGLADLEPSIQTLKINDPANGQK
jgi:hypothetical protein